MHNRNRGLFIITGLLLLLPLMTGAAVNGIAGDDASSLSAEEQVWLDRKKEILFVSQVEYPPFEYTDSDSLSDGMSIELARWIATEFGFKARFRHMPFLDAQKAILSGEADVLTSLFYSRERDGKFDFTGMTWEVPALIFVQSDRPDIKELSDLMGKNVAMQRGDYAGDFLKERNINYRMIPTDSFAEAVDLVIAGEADALIGDKQIVLYHLFSNQLLDKMKSVGSPLYTGLNGMAVKEDSKILQSILNKGIIRARESGIFIKITEKWTGRHYATPPPAHSKYLPLVLVGLVSLIAMTLLIGIWNLQLRHIVSIKTAELQKNELHLRSLFSAVPDILWFKEPDGKYGNCNSRFEKLYGADESEIKGKTDFDFFDRERAESFDSFDRKAKEKKATIVNEEVVTFADDGHKEILEILRSPIFDDKGSFTGILGIARDITKRVRAEEKLKESETFLNSIVENIPNMVFVKDSRTLQFVRLNKAAEKLLGYGTEELIGKSDYDFFPSEEADFFAEKDREVLRNGNVVDIPEEYIQTKKGELKILHTKKLPIVDSEGEPRYLMGISEDITEQKQFEDLLHIQQNLGIALGATADLNEALRICLDAALQVAEVDSGGIYRVESAMESLSLVDHYNLPEEFVRTVSHFNHKMPQYWIVENGEPVYSSFAGMIDTLQLKPEIRLKWEDAGLRAIAVIPILHNGSPLASLNLASTQHERFSQYTKASLEAIASQAAGALARICSDKALLASRQNFQTLFDSINDFLLIVDSTGKIEHWNPTVEKRLGYSSEKLRTMHIRDLLPPEERDNAEKIIARMLEGRTRTNSLPIKKSNGHMIPVETQVSVGQWNGEKAIFGVSRDISARIRSDEKIRKALQEKETLLKEIHHRVKNNLQVVSSLLSLQAESTQDSTALYAFTEAENRVHSMSLVHEILYRSDNLDEIPLQEYLEMLADHLQNVFIARDFEISIDAGDIILNIQQAVPCGLIMTELIANSLKHAFSDRRNNIVEIRVSNRENHSIRAEIIDNGCGLPEGFNPREVKSLGLRLITDLIEDQLEGTWELRGDEGTKWIVTWPVYDMRRSNGII